MNNKRSKTMDKTNAIGLETAGFYCGTYTRHPFHQTRPIHSENRQGCIRSCSHGPFCRRRGNGRFGSGQARVNRRSHSYRYVRYLATHNGNSLKQEISFAQSGGNDILDSPIIPKVKDFAAEINIQNARAHNMRSESEISREHVTNNQAVRQTLLNRGIRPESLLPAEDVKKVERRLSSDEKRALTNPDTLEGA